ncbi:MAG: DUF1330 domain-containing protein [Actinomycetes bacterium]|jgi:uncharacterized protein (DUF1330 family)
MSESPAGYWIISALVTDPQSFGGYTGAAGPVIAGYGGRAIVTGAEFDVVEGEAAGRPYIIEFASLETARNCYFSEGYQAAIALRSGSANFRVVIAEGAPKSQGDK